MPETADWYFDFLSPFAYIMSERMPALPEGMTIRYRPVLFAGLLQHWGQLGPAEIPPKRRFVFRYCQWQAERLGIPFRMPPAHPFPPLVPLRLAIACDAEPRAVHAIFRFIWGEGRMLDDAESRREIAQRLGLSEIDEAISKPAVKEKLRTETEAAIERGVFGVPTLAIGEELFWGFDAGEMALDYLKQPDRFRSPAFARIDTLPVAARR